MTDKELLTHLKYNKYGDYIPLNELPKLTYNKLENIFIKYNLDIKPTNLFIHNLNIHYNKKIINELLTKVNREEKINYLLDKKNKI